LPLDYQSVGDFLLRLKFSEGEAAEYQLSVIPLPLFVCPTYSPQNHFYLVGRAKFDASQQSGPRVVLESAE